MIWLIWTAAPRGLERGPCRGPARSVPTIGRCRDGVGARGPAFHLVHRPVAHPSIILLKNISLATPLAKSKANQHTIYYGQSIQW